MGITVAIVFLLLILAALLHPLWRPPVWAFGEALGPASRMAALQERKLALYGAIRETGFDLRTDKLSEADYRTEVGRLKGEAVEVVAQIEELRSRPPRGPDSLERMISSAGERLIVSENKKTSTDTPTGGGSEVFCTQCGRQAAARDRFCAVCGANLHDSA